MLLWKHFLGFLAAKASVYEPFYTLEVSCLAGCDSDLINATQAEAKWVSLDFSRGSSLVLNPLHAIHGILETQNSKRNDPAKLIRYDIRHHPNCTNCIFSYRILCACPACPTIAQVRLASQCDTSESDAARVVERHASLQLCLDDQIVTAWKQSENIVKLPSEQNWSFFLTKLQAMFYTLVRWHSTASAPLIPSGSWSAQLDVSSLRPGGPLCIEGITGHTKSRYLEDCFMFKSFYKNHEKRVWKSEKKRCPPRCIMTLL